MTATIVPAHTVDPVFGCWSLPGARTDDDGYTLLPDGRRAHRVVYQARIGPIPQGKVIDHTCRRRWCFAPHHLEPVTQNVNEQRKSWRNRVRVATCANGHDMRVNSIVTPEGGRVCRSCR